MIDTKDFIQLIRDFEIQDFPEFKEGNVYASTTDLEVRFAPSWHFKNGLLTEELVNDIKDNKKEVLSIGSGYSYLEQFLVNRLGISKDQIVLSDIFPVMPEGFQKFIFDMYRDWPEFKRKFDYILFPASVEVSVSKKYEYDKNRGMVLTLKRKSDEEKRNDLYYILYDSFKTMKPNGQIRIDGHGEGKENVEIVREKINRNYQDLSLLYSPMLIIVKRTYSSNT